MGGGIHFSLLLDSSVEDSTGRHLDGWETNRIRGEDVLKMW